MSLPAKTLLCISFEKTWSEPSSPGSNKTVNFGAVGATCTNSQSWFVVFVSIIFAFWFEKMIIQKQKVFEKVLMPKTGQNLPCN
jgi:hypothetical protein